MKSEDAVDRLQGLDAELMVLEPTWKTAAFESWQLRTRSVLGHSIGKDQHITEAFNRTHWSSLSFDDSADRHQFEQSRMLVHGMFEAAIAELQMLADEVPIADEEGVDPELWERVAPETQAEAWDKVALNAVVFTEDRIRKWAGRPPGEVGKDLAVAIFGPSGDYRMGLVDPEKQGWQLFAQGIAMALRNVDTHRIQERPDHKRYALGVVGACSLLLTQMRFEHGNRFQDTSPPAAEQADD